MRAKGSWKRKNRDQVGLLGVRASPQRTAPLVKGKHLLHEKLFLSSQMLKHSVEIYRADINVASVMIQMSLQVLVSILSS